MSVQSNAQKPPVQTSDDTQASSVAVPVDDDQISVRGGSKEVDSQRFEEAKLLREFVKESHDADKEAERQVKDAIGEAKLARPEVKISADIAQHGVKSPEEDAYETLEKGSTITLTATEEAYEKGKGTKVKGKISSITGNVSGVLSIAALAMYIGRIIKIAHRHARRVIFRNSSAENSKGEGKESE